MRSIDAGVLAELEAKELRPFVLLHMNVDGTDYRHTDCDVPIVYGGNRYEPYPFAIEQARYSMADIVDSITIDIDTLDRTYVAAFVGGTPQGSDVVVYGVVLDASYDIIGTATTLFQGEIDSWSLDEKRLTISVTSEMVQWTEKTLNIHSSNCRWQEFKGTECGYAGAATWCDRTYTRCSTLANTDNFGGFRFLAALTDKTIWWGRAFKQPLEDSAFAK